MWRNILVPTDFSGAARQALQLAVRLAPPGCTVHVMHVITPTESDPYSPVRLRPEGQARQRLPEEVTDELLQQLIQEVATDQVAVARAWRRASDVVGAVLDYADTVEAELIVLGTHGRRGLQRFLLGSVAEAIVRRASVPVLTVREHARVPEAIQHILVPTDFSEDARMALREAARWAAHFRARLTLLHVLAPAVIPVSVTEVAAVYEVVPGLQERLHEERSVRPAHRRRTGRSDHPGAGPTGTGRSDRDGYPRSLRRGPLAAGQRDRTRAAPGALSGTYPPPSRTAFGAFSSLSESCVSKSPTTPPGIPLQGRAFSSGIFSPL